jgi:hypothetical protein
MRASLNVSIFWEINSYDKNTFHGKGISEQNKFSQNTYLALINIPPKSKMIFEPVFQFGIAIQKIIFAL